MGNLIIIICVVSLFAVGSFFVRKALVRRKLVCPRSKQEVEVAVLCQGFSGDGKALEIKSCSAFENPKQINCKQDCIHTPE